MSIEERQPPAISRNAAIVTGVLVFHALAIWALQTGLVRRVAEIIVPAEVLSEIIEPPAPKTPPPPPPPPPPQKVPQPKAALPPAPMPVAIADPTPAPNAPTGVTTPQPPPPPIAAPVAAAPPAAPPAPPAPPKIELPSSDADYLQNPRPPYPPISKRLGEQGKVVVRVLIGTDGLPQKSELAKTSGFDRLDQVAIATVMKWRYVPGKRNGVAETMWFNVPINFVLE